MNNKHLALYECIQRLEHNGLMYFYIDKDLKLYVHADFELGQGVRHFIREHYWEIHELLHTTRRHIMLAM